MNKKVIYFPTEHHNLIIGIYHWAIVSISDLDIKKTFHSNRFSISFLWQHVGSQFEMQLVLLGRVQIWHTASDQQITTALEIFENVDKEVETIK